MGIGGGGGSGTSDNVGSDVVVGSGSGHINDTEDSLVVNVGNEASMSGTPREPANPSVEGGSGRGVSGAGAGSSGSVTSSSSGSSDGSSDGSTTDSPPAMSSRAARAASLLKIVEGNVKNARYEVDEGLTENAKDFVHGVSGSGTGCASAGGGGVGWRGDVNPERKCSVIILISGYDAGVSMFAKFWKMLFVSCGACAASSTVVHAQDGRHEALFYGTALQHHSLPLQY